MQRYFLKLVTLNSVVLITDKGNVKSPEHSLLLDAALVLANCRQIKVDNQHFPRPLSQLSSTLNLFKVVIKTSTKCSDQYSECKILF